jgi:hypothetical protein
MRQMVAVRTHLARAISASAVCLLLGIPQLSSQIGHASSLPSSSSTATPCGPAPAQAVPGSGYPRAVHLGFHPLAFAVSDGSSHVFAGGSDPCTGKGLVAMLDARTGTLLHTASVDGNPAQMVVDDRVSSLFVSAGSPYPTSVSTIDTRSGRVVRTARFGQLVAAIGVDRHTERVFIAVDVVTHPAGGHASETAQVQVLDARTGRVVRVVNSTVGPISISRSTDPGSASLAVDEPQRRVYVAGTGGIGVLDAAVGGAMRLLRLGQCGGEVGIDERVGRLYTASRGKVRDRYNPTDQRVNPPGYFCVIDTSADKVVYKRNEGAGVGAALLAVDAPANIVLVAKAGYLGESPASAVNARDGRELRHSIGLQHPPAPAVDPQTGRVFFASDLRNDIARRGEITTLRVLDAKSLRTSIMVKKLPAVSAMAVAGRARRIFLGSLQTDTVTVMCADRTC